MASYLIFASLICGVPQGSVLKHLEFCLYCQLLLFSGIIILAIMSTLKTHNYRFLSNQRPIWSIGKVKQLYFRQLSVDDQNKLKINDSKLNMYYFDLHSVKQV